MHIFWNVDLMNCGFGNLTYIKERSMFMILSKEQFDKLPNEYKQYFVRKVGDVGSDEQTRKNVHPT
jgi:hypothetical protein